MTLQAPLSVRFPSKNPGEGCHFLLQGSFRARDWTRVSCVGKQVLCRFPTWTAACGKGDAPYSVYQFMLIISSRNTPVDTPRTMLHLASGQPLSQASFINCYLFPSLPQRDPGFCLFVHFYQDSSSSGEGNNQTFCRLLALTLNWYCS